MERSEFLKEISSMTREEMQERIKEKDRTHKKVYPAVYLDRERRYKSMEERLRDLK